MNLTRQPLLLALLTLLAIVAATFLIGRAVPSAEESLTIAGAQLRSWQAAWPRAARAISAVLAVASALTVGRIGVRHNLYAGGSLLAIPLYAIIACGVFLPGDCLTGFISSFLLARVMRNYCTSYRNGYAFTSLFRGSLYLGILPLLYAPALLLIVLLPLAALLFKRTFRELIVATGGVLLPISAFCYLHWAFGGELTTPVEQLFAALMAGSGFHLLGHAPLAAILQLIVLLSAVLCALFYFLNDLYASSSKARAILTVVAWLFVLCCSAFLLPGTTAELFPLLAVPASLMLPFLFVRLKTSLANSLYAAILLLSLLNLLLPAGFSL